MIKGHGDDIYMYENIRMNFSSNICQHADLTPLKEYLATKLDLIANYPEPEPWSIKELIAKKHGVHESCITITSGATEAIYLVAQAFPYNHCFPRTTFSEYRDACRMFPVERPKKHVRWICNPNNPTGEVVSTAVISKQTKLYDLLVIDQSYENYTDAEILTPSEALRLHKVIQIHSLTKTYGIPGLRIGYIVAPPALTKRIRKFLRPWSVNALAIEAAHFLLTHDLSIKPDLKEAQRLRARLSEIEGISVNHTRTNFMLCKIKGQTAAELKSYLAKEHGMLIRDARNFGHLTANYFRVAAQTPEEDDALVEAIQQFMKSV